MNLSLFLLFLFSYLPPMSAVNPRFTACSQTIQCGNLTNITYPFYDGFNRPEYCGYPGLKLDCENGTPQINISDQVYNLLGINKTANTTIRVSVNDFNLTNACPDRPFNTTINPSIFSFPHADQNLTFFYGCTQLIPANFLLQTECDNLGSGLSSNYAKSAYYATRGMLERMNGSGLFWTCKSVLIPILQSAADLITMKLSLTAVIDALQAGFDLGLIVDAESCGLCVESGGTCGFNSTTHRFVCYCPDSPDANFNITCEAVRSTTQFENHTRGKRNSNIILYSACSGSAAFILLILAITVYSQRGKIEVFKVLSRDNLTRMDTRNVENALKSYESLAPKRCTYSDIKRMTNSFAEKLGEGGFGRVYKGKLLDGRLVAVKLQKVSKGNGEGFINEVASIGRTNHVNVVRLLGFCFEGNKRALVYEYISNGSLDKLIHGHSALPLETLFQVVLGVARGLEYLHRGCHTRILHFDIKPHNILLDEEFCPKISDFGLAKLTPRNKQSKVSMSGARGTVGYIAPEVFCRSFGDVSHKSDVYSYGMLVLEVIGSRKRANTHQVESSSEQYFPNWIYKQLEHEEELEDDINLNDNDKELKRKMIVVSLWCIQPVPSSRPSMSRVVQMLEGSLESIEVPTMPSHSSPPRIQWDPSSSSTMSVSIAPDSNH